MSKHFLSGTLIKKEENIVSLSVSLCIYATIQIVNFVKRHMCEMCMHACVHIHVRMYACMFAVCMHVRMDVCVYVLMNV